MRVALVSREAYSCCTDQVYGVGGVTFGAFSFRWLWVIPASDSLCFFANSSFRAALVLRYDSAMEWQATMRQNKSPKAFSPARYRVPRANGSNTLLGRSIVNRGKCLQYLGENIIYIYIFIIFAP